MTDDDDVLGDGARLLDALNRQEFERARAKITKAPLDLTERDLLVLKAYGGAQLEGQAWGAQRVAVLALVPPSPAALVTKGVEAAARTSSSLAKHFDAFGDGDRHHQADGGTHEGTHRGAPRAKQNIVGSCA